MTEQLTLGEIDADAGEQENQPSSEDGEVDHPRTADHRHLETDGHVLFHLTDDPFVNEAIGELARELQSTRDISVEVAPAAVIVPAAQEVEPVVETVDAAVQRRLEHTHVRAGRARRLNGRLDEMGAGPSDERWVPSPDRPFPGRASALTIYEDNELNSERLEEANLDPEDVLNTLSGEHGLYVQNPEFLGSSSSKHFPESQIPRYERYFEAFRTTLRGEHDADDEACLNCGRVDMPTYKDADDEKLEYNQTFTPLASEAGSGGALGYRSRTSAHTGRCAACLVAGFYYAIMEKIVRPTGSTSNDSRVFAPVGTLDELVNIRDDFHSFPDKHDIDPPTPNDYYGRQTIGRLRTPARGMQILEFYEQALQHLNTTVEGDELFQRELKHRPTELVTLISEVGQTRTISNVQSIAPDEWAYQACQRRTVSSGDGEESYWPVADVLAWFVSLRTDDDNSHAAIQNSLSYGILERSLKRIEQALFETTKLLDRSENASPFTPNPHYRTDYFQYIMSHAHSVPDRIDDDAIESIRRVGSAIGRVFHGQDDIGVLIKLQNASTPATFLQAFEKAAMQAQKRSHEAPPSRFEASKDEDVSRVLRLVGDEETFEAAKRMFVIHASLAAQYESIVDNYDSSSAENTASDTADT